MTTLTKDGLYVIAVATFLAVVVRFSGQDEYAVALLPAVGLALIFVARHVWEHFHPPTPPAVQPETRYTRH